MLTALLSHLASKNAMTNPPGSLRGAAFKPAMFETRQPVGAFCRCFHSRARFN